MTTPKDRIADDVAEHLARLFKHADQLLLEWKRYSENLRDSLDQQAVEAGERAAQAMRTSLGELNAPRRSASSRASWRGPWVWAVAVNLVVGVVLAFLIVGQGGSEPASAIADAVPVVIEDASVPDAALVVDAAPPPPPLCAGLLRGAVRPRAIDLVRACAIVACDHEPPAKDPRDRALRKTLGSCQPDREAATILALSEILSDRKAIGRCLLAREVDGSFAVNERFVASCSGGKPGK